MMTPARGIFAQDHHFQHDPAKIWFGGLRRSEAAMSAQDEKALPFLTAAQVNHFLAGFRQIDRLLCSIEEVLHGSGDSLFPHTSPDLKAPQKERLLHFVAEMRSRMERILQAHGLAVPPARVSASRAVNSAMTFIDIALSDLRPKVMQGYGDVGASSAEELDRIVTELRALEGEVQHELRLGVSEK
jgi:hypothetical protein